MEDNNQAEHIQAYSYLWEAVYMLADLEDGSIPNDHYGLIMAILETKREGYKPKSLQDSANKESPYYMTVHTLTKCIKYVCKGDSPKQAIQNACNDTLEPFDKVWKDRDSFYSSQGIEQAIEANKRRLGRLGINTKPLLKCKSAMRLLSALSKAIAAINTQKELTTLRNTTIELKLSSIDTMQGKIEYLLSEGWKPKRIQERLDVPKHTYYRLINK